MPARILIVDDHQLAREGLKAVLSADGFEIVAEAACGEDAVTLTSQLVPDVVLMDVRLGPGIDGLEATRRIAALGLPTRVLVLSLHEMPAYVREALAVATVMSVTGSFDHRAIDGADGAQLMQAFKGLVEQPLGLVA